MDSPYYITNLYEDKYYLSNKKFTKYWKVDKDYFKFKKNILSPNARESFFCYNPIDKTKKNINIIGMQYSKGSLVDSDTDKFPDFLRKFSKKIQVFNNIEGNGCSGIFDFDYNKTLFEGLVFEDLGDITIERIDQNNIILLDLIENSFTKNIRNIFIGGDHSISYLIIKHIVETGKELIPIIFDAHHDTRYTHSNQEKINHANFVSKLIEINNIKKILQIGIRGIRPMNCMIESEKISYHKIESSSIIKEIKKFTNKYPNAIAYLSIDLDVLNPNSFPCVDFPQSGGPNHYQLINKIEEIFSTKIDICNIDIVEGLPKSEDTSFDIVIQVLAHCMDQLFKKIKMDL